MPVEPGTVAHIALADHQPIELLAIPGGSFLMGSLDNEPGHNKYEGPVCEVHLSPFEMARYPVTQAQWREVMGSNPGSAEHGRGPMRPVYNVSWPMAIEFLNKLSERERLSPCYQEDHSDAHWDRTCDGYRLATEAEWEYACRAGTQTIYSFGDDPDLLERYAWYADNSGGTVQDVGALQPNDWGLYDMNGNVWEWLWDFHWRYPPREKRDPSGPPKGRVHMLRGGSFQDTPMFARAAVRAWDRPWREHKGFGFRVSRGRPRPPP